MLTNEEAVIGACLLANHVIPEAAKYVQPADFANWIGEQIFEAILAVHGEGHVADVISVQDKLVSMGVKFDILELHRLEQQVPTASNVAYYAEQVAEAAVRRRVARTLQTGLQRINDEAQATTSTLADTLDDLKEIRDHSAYSSIRGGTAGAVMAEADQYDWIIKGLLERGDRYMLTGDEGAGKSMFMIQFAVFAAAGIHPFYLYPIEPLKVVILDYENTERQWRRKARNLFNAASAVGQGDPANMYLENDTRGVDLLSTKGLGYVHKVLDRNPCDLLVMGPLYKLVPKAINTDDDAAPLLAALDSIRQRGCAMLTEAHAGHQRQGNLHPVGSSAFLRWPEFGHGLRKDIADPERRVVLERWRGDRDKRSFPEALTRGTGAVAWVPDDVSPVQLDRVNGWDRPEPLDPDERKIQF